MPHTLQMDQDPVKIQRTVWIINAKFQGEIR